MMRPSDIAFRLYLVALFTFVFLPILTSMVFSLNSDRFPTVPLGEFTTHWYKTAFSRSEVWTAFGNSLIVAVCAAALSTALGFVTAYTDFRYGFRFKPAYLALALLPPTIPLVIMGLAMLAWLGRLGISGTLSGIVVAHTVMGAPFAMAICRLRLSQMDPALEAAAWNLGASQWRAMRAVVIPFCLPALISAYCLTTAVSFDEFIVAWFVSGLNKTVPVMILEILQGNVDPQINAIGTVVFLTSMALVIVAQLLILRKTNA
ncbi:ABC transporter permease [Mameliella alba]|uniref:ABC transporter permease n=1 Tax=Mameliella alba TaxID=561184 RepID=UPI000B52E29E|nr:ABC transporter permease [Mameliella alba]MBY6119265.1 ABC transporter permease [Mameliella alba]OWV45084.1 polyamine ABC transporter permease [Mameliella alba]OWV66734.1 polyamine ABC transporter permease [Mameliella alba]